MRGETQIITGDALTALKTLEGESVHCCVTSPPYWGLRDYGVDGQLGVEHSLTEYVSKLVKVFDEVKRVLRSDGTLWLNLGDCYAFKGRSHTHEGMEKLGERYTGGGHKATKTKKPCRELPEGLKPKDLVGLPWRVAFALREAGWYLRSDIVWQKPNCMPSSVRDRPTNSHESIFLLAKSPRYFYDQDAIREPITTRPQRRLTKTNPSDLSVSPHRKYSMSYQYDGCPPGHALGRNKRDVWTVPTRPYKGAHFAVFPPELIRPCIRAGCPEGGTVLDPFLGSGTTAVVALEEGRNCIGVELKAEYVEMAKKRLAG